MKKQRYVVVIYHGKHESPYINSKHWNMAVGLAENEKELIENLGKPKE